MSVDFLSPSFAPIDLPDQTYVCGRCGGLLKASTYEKYGGYSAQCRKKQLLEDQHVHPKSTSTTIQHSKSKTIKLYSYKQFCFIWAIKDLELGKKYYKKYLSRYMPLTVFTKDLLYGQLTYE